MSNYEDFISTAMAYLSDSIDKQAAKYCTPMGAPDLGRFPADYPERIDPTGLRKDIETAFPESPFRSYSPRGPATRPWNVNK